MAPGLPSHLASFLRHVPDEVPEVATASETGRAARRRAARSKRKLRKAEKATQERDSKRDAKADKAELATHKVAKPVAQVPATREPEHLKKRTPQRDGSVKKLKLKSKKVAAAPKAAANSTMASLFDPEGAARDEALIRKLEKNLGIGRDPEKKKKEERRIFEALGFDADGGVEEPPSDEDAPEEIASSHGPQRRRPEKPEKPEDSSAEAMASLLETILGATPRSTTDSTVKKLQRRTGRPLKKLRAT